MTVISKAIISMLSLFIMIKTTCIATSFSIIPICITDLALPPNIIKAEKTKGRGQSFGKYRTSCARSTGKFMLTVFAALSQLEREQIKQRQREGIKIAKAQGKYTGRKPIPTDWTKFGQLYGEWRAKNITGRDFMRRMDMSANTFYRRVREYEIRNGITAPSSA